MRGSVLGLGALSLTLVAFITQLLHSRLRVFPVIQQSFVLLLLVGLNQLIYYWMQGLVGNSADSLLFLVPALTSALLWPFVFSTLRRLARSLDLN
jgi:rod shape-determining protein MreD